MEQEIRRPTFVYREKPVPDICGFVSFEQLVKTVEGLRALAAQSMRADFLEQLAEFFNDDDEAGEDAE